MFGFIRFNCKFCSNEFRFSERRMHLLTCAGVKLDTCAFGCTGVTATMTDHLRNQCQRQPSCGSCDFRVYTKYHMLSRAATVQGSGNAQIPQHSGHNCLRDNAQSDKLLVTLR